jgi:hypothetical protein
MALYGFTDKEIAEIENQRRIARLLEMSEE